MEIPDAVNTRKIIRVFKANPLPQVILRAIMEALRKTPS
jgi:hypothetical protein